MEETPGTTSATFTHHQIFPFSPSRCSGHRRNPRFRFARIKLDPSVGANVYEIGYRGADARPPSSRRVWQRICSVTVASGSRRRRARLKSELNSRETEAGLRRWPEHLEGETGKIDGALNVADVVPGALLHDPPRLRQGGRRRLKETACSADPRDRGRVDWSTSNTSRKGKPLVRVRKLDEEESDTSSRRSTERGHLRCDAAPTRQYGHVQTAPRPHRFLNITLLCHDIGETTLEAQESMPPRAPGGSRA